MKEYIRKRWFIDNPEKFARTLFDRRQSLLDEYVEENSYYYKGGRIPRFGEKLNPLVKVVVKKGIPYIRITQLLDDMEYETYVSAEFEYEKIADAKSFLQSLGYVQKGVLEKKVLVYSMKNEKFSKIYINEYKWGSYVKMVDTKEAIGRLAYKLRLNPKGQMRESILDVYKKYLLSHSLGIDKHISYR